MSDEKTVEERLAELEQEIEEIKTGEALKSGSIGLRHVDGTIHSELFDPR